MSTEEGGGRPALGARKAWLVTTSLKSLNSNEFGLKPISLDEWTTARVVPPSGRITDELNEARLRVTVAASPYPSVLLVQYTKETAALVGAGVHAPPEPWLLSRADQGSRFQTLQSPPDWIRWSTEVASTLPSVIKLPKGVVAEGVELARWVLMEAGIMFIDEELMNRPVDGFGGAMWFTGGGKEYLYGQVFNMRIERFVLGWGKGRWGRFIGIWDREHPEKPIRRYPVILSGLAERAYWRLARPGIPSGKRRPLE